MSGYRLGLFSRPIAAVVLLSIVVLAPTEAQDTAQLESWQGRMAETRELMVEQLWSVAVERSTLLLEDMVSSPMASAAEVRELLAAASAQRAIALAGMGRNQAAVWDLYIAANLNPDFFRASFAAFGQPGLFLEGYRELSLGAEGGRAIAVRVGQLPPSARSPVLVEGGAVGFRPAASELLEGAPELRVEFVIDREGAVRDPLVKGEIREPLLVLTSLWILESWRFEPGTVDGQAREFLYDVALPLTREVVEQAMNELDAAAGVAVAAGSSSAAADVLASAEAAVRAWADAWARQDVEAYLAAYVEAYRPRNGPTHDEWRTQRRQRITKPEFIEVALDGLTSRQLADDRIEVSFQQSYRSGSYVDQVQKTIVVVREGGVWRIASETSS